MEHAKKEPVTLINIFEVPVGAEHNFVEWWNKSSEVLMKEPGFIDAKLHRSLKAGSPFQFINIAHWETAEALDLARAKHSDVLRSLSKGKGHPALYEVVSRYA